MESQESTTITADSTSARGPHVVKPNVPISPGFQPRPQGPYGSPRQPLNNGPIDGPRPVGPPAQIRRLDSRTSFGPPTPGQFVRSYGPPRPPGNIFPQRPPQPGQNPQNTAIVLNPRCPPSPGLRGPGPHQGPRPSYPGNPYGQQFQRGNIQRPQHPRPELSNQNGPPQHSQIPESGTPRAGQENLGQKQFQRNESSLNILQQNPPSSAEENKQINRPRIIIDKMADVDKSKPQQAEDNIQKKKSDIRENGENDDDDDVVMDNEKSPRTNGSAAYDNEGFLHESKTPETPKKLEDPGQTVKRPGTATIDSKLITKPNEIITDEIDDSTSRTLPEKSDKSDKTEKPVDVALNMYNANNVDQKLTTVKNDDKTQSKESFNTTEIKQPSKTDTVVNKVEENKKKSLTTDTTSKEPKSPVSKAAEEKKDDKAVIENSENEQSLQAPTETPDKSRSSSPDEMKQAHKEELKATSKSPSKSPTPTLLVEESQNQKEPESPSKPLDKTRTNTPTDANHSLNKEETKSPSKSPDTQVDNCRDIKSEISNIAENQAEVDNAKISKTEVDSVAKSSVNAVSEAAKSEVTKSSENPHRDKSAGNSLEVNDATRSALRSPSSEKGGRKSPKSPITPEENQLSVSGSASSPLRSSQESVKGFDNGERRSLSPRSSPCRSPQSPVSLKSSKSPTDGTPSIGNEKKRTTFAEDSITKKESNDKGDTSKPTTPESNVHRAPTPAKLYTGKKSTKKQEVENGTAANDSSQSNAVPTTNGVGDSPTKKTPSISRETDKRSTAGSPVKSPSKSTKSLPRTPETPSSTAAQEKKKVPMNKVQVGSAPSPNLKTVRSKIGSLENASYKPGGGKVKIENRKLDFSKAQPKIAAKNEKYTPSGGDKKIAQVKLQWNAKPKVGSLDNATYKPGGGDKKIETVKLDFKDKAKPKVGSKDNAKHVPGGGGVKSSATPPKTPQDTNNDIQTQKIDIKAESKIGSLDNVKHKPGGGDKKIFNDKDYLRQTGSNVESLSGSGSQVQTPEENNPDSTDRLSKDDSPQPPPSTPIKVRNPASPTSVVTPRAVRTGLAKSPETPGSKRSLTSLAEVSVPMEGNKTDIKSEDTQSKSIPRDKTPKSPSTPRPPSSLRLKSPEKSSPAYPRKSSPKELRLPKLAPSPVAQDANPITDTHSKITLPKLIEPSSQSTRLAY